MYFLFCIKILWNNAKKTCIIFKWTFHEFEKALLRSCNDFKNKSKRKYLPSKNKKFSETTFFPQNENHISTVCTTTKLSIGFALVTSNGKLSRKENSFSSRKNATNLLSQSFSGKSYHQHERQRLMFCHSGSCSEKAPSPTPKKYACPWQSLASWSLVWWWRWWNSLSQHNNPERSPPLVRGRPAPVAVTRRDLAENLKLSPLPLPAQKALNGTLQLWEEGGEVLCFSAGKGSIWKFWAKLNLN